MADSNSMDPPTAKSRRPSLAAEIGAGEARRRRLVHEIVESEMRFAATLAALPRVREAACSSYNRSIKPAASISAPNRSSVRSKTTSGGSSLVNSVDLANVANGQVQGVTLEENGAFMHSHSGQEIQSMPNKVSPQMRCLFTTLEQIGTLSRATVRALQKAVREFAWDRVAAVLLRLADAMFLYEEYAGMHCFLEDEINTLASDPEFSRLWRSATAAAADSADLDLWELEQTTEHHYQLQQHMRQSQHQQHRNQQKQLKLPTSLSSFLILPIQRVPRYELLLEELRRQADLVESLEVSSKDWGHSRRSHQWWIEEQQMVIEARDKFRDVAARMETAIHNAQSRPFLLAVSLREPPSYMHQLPTRGRTKSDDSEYGEENGKVNTSEPFVSGASSINRSQSVAIVIQELLDTEVHNLRNLIVAEETWVLTRVKQVHHLVMQSDGYDPEEVWSVLGFAQSVLHFRQLSCHIVRVLQDYDRRPSSPFWDDLCWLSNIIKLTRTYVHSFLVAWRRIAPRHQSLHSAIPSWLWYQAEVAYRILGPHAAVSASLSSVSSSQNSILKLYGAENITSENYVHFREPLERIARYEADFAVILMHPGSYRARRPDFAEAWTTVQQIVPSVCEYAEQKLSMEVLSVLAPAVDLTRDELSRAGVLMLRKRPYLACLLTDRLLLVPFSLSSSATVTKQGIRVLGASETFILAVQTPMSAEAYSSEYSSPRGLSLRRTKSSAGKHLVIYLRDVNRIVAEAQSMSLRLEPQGLTLNLPETNDVETEQYDIYAKWTLPVPSKGHSQALIFDNWVRSLTSVKTISSLAAPPPPPES